MSEIENEKLIEKYDQLNRSYKHKLIYCFGLKGGGMYSQINNILLGVLYALHNKMRFEIYSRNTPLSFGNGWKEFFEVFCPCYNNHIVGECISDVSSGRRHIVPELYKFFTRNLTQSDVCQFTLTNWFYYTQFNIPELGINGNLRDALKKIIPIVYNLNSNYRKEVDDFIEGLNVPAEFVGFHVRGGDKITERNLIDPQEYIMRAEKRTSCRKGFVFTDDYSIFESLKNNNPHWELYTSAFPNERGYDNSFFLSKTDSERKKDVVKMFASIELLMKSKLFVGTFSANPGLFIGMQKEDEEMIGMDFERFLII